MCVLFSGASVNAQGCSVDEENVFTRSRSVSLSLVPYLSQTAVESSRAVVVRERLERAARAHTGPGTRIKARSVKTVCIEASSLLLTTLPRSHVQKCLFTSLISEILKVVIRGGTIQRFWLMHRFKRQRLQWINTTIMNWFWFCEKGQTSSV